MVWLLIGYMFLFIHRPFEVWPFLGAIHLERVYMIGTLLVYVATLPTRARWISNRQHWAIFGFAGAVVLSWLCSPWQDHCDPTVENYFKLMVFYLLLVTTIHSEHDLKRIWLGFLAVMFLYMAHSFVEYHNGKFVWAMGTYRMTGVNEVGTDPNTFASTIVYALPLVLPFWRASPSARMKLFLIAYVGLSLACILLTGSRGGLVGVILLTCLLLATVRQRFRLALLALVAAPLIWMLLPGQLQRRFESIVDPEMGTAGARMSAEGRIQGFWMGVDLLQRYPFTGCGPGAWRPSTGSDLESHNLYGQLMGELGTVGIVTFGAFLLGVASNIRRVRALYQREPGRDRDWLYQAMISLGLAFTLLLVQGFFGHTLFRFNWMWYAGFLIITRYCIEQRWRFQHSGVVMPVLNTRRPWQQPVPLAGVVSRHS